MTLYYIGQDPRLATDRVLIDATNEAFWQITRYKPGRKLDMENPRDHAMSKKWLEIYAQIRGHRDRATSLGLRAFNETRTPYILVIEQRDGSLHHQTFTNRGDLNVEYAWILEQPELYTYLAMFDFTQNQGAPIGDQFALSKRKQLVTSGWHA